MNRAAVIAGVIVVIVLGAFGAMYMARTPTKSSQTGMAGGPSMVEAATSTVGTTAAPQQTPDVHQPPSALRTIVLGGQTLHVMVADTPAKQQQGLGGLASLPWDEGMLFIFPQDGEYAFWMKDMHFSIDMLWLADNGTVVYMAQDVSPATYPSVFTPTTPARYVLELPAGWAKAYNVHTGGRATL